MEPVCPCGCPTSGPCRCAGGCPLSGLPLSAVATPAPPAQQAASGGPRLPLLQLGLLAVGLTFSVLAAVCPGWLKPQAPTALAHPSRGALVARTPTVSRFAVTADVMSGAVLGTLSHPVNLWVRLDRLPQDGGTELCVWLADDVNGPNATLAARLPTSGLNGGDVRPREFTVDLKPAIRAAFARQHIRGGAFRDFKDVTTLDVRLTCEPKRTQSVTKAQWASVIDGRYPDAEHNEAVIRDATLEFSDAKLHRLAMLP